MGVVIRTVPYVCITFACLAETCGTQCRMMLSVRDMLCERLKYRNAYPVQGRQLSSTIAMHKGPVTAAGRPARGIRGLWRMTGGQDTDSVAVLCPRAVSRPRLTHAGGCCGAAAGCLQVPPFRRCIHMSIAHHVQCGMQRILRVDSICQQSLRIRSRL